jgi:hypothetical protein
MSPQDQKYDPPSRVKRTAGITAFAVLSVLLFSGQTAPTTCHENIGPSTGEVVGVAVAAGAVIAVAILVPVEVSKSHHILKGCVYAGPNGVSLQTSDAKNYILEGDPSAIKVGDMVKFHGVKVKKTKDSKGDQVFKIAEMKKDYGPCHVTAPPATAP